MVKLSSYIELLSQLNRQKTATEYIAVITSRKSKIFILNEIIFSFLEQFHEPTTLEAVVESYKEKVVINSEKDLELLVNNLTHFYDDLYKKKWIVPEDKEEPIINYETLYNIGDTFLTYNVLAILGNKRLTDVYLVKDHNTNKKTVIKLLNRNKFNDDKSFVKYEVLFNEEYLFLKKFNSNYINKAISYFNFEAHTCIHLKAEPGESIKRLYKTRTLNANEKKQLVLKIFKAFSIIHKANVFHGDIHFSNILISKALQPTVIDFGYANEYVEGDTNAVSDLRNGGVYKFIPPERALRSIQRRFEAVTQFQSEVYQIGLIVYFIYFNNLPFKSDTWKTMVDEKRAFNVQEHKPFKNKPIAKSIKTFIAKCLENEPEKRYKNAEEMYLNWKRLVLKK